MFHWRGGRGLVEAAFTDRFGGLSAEAMNAFAPRQPVVSVHQVHGAVVLTPAEANAATERCADCGQAMADGLVTDEPGVVLRIKVADCLPLLLADAESGVIGAAHVGRKGLVSGVAGATVTRMREFGAGRVTAWIGPHICGACYEVPEAMRDEVVALVPGSASTTSWGTPSIDIAAGLRGQLAALDVEVVDVSACTRESLALDSYRRDGAGSGRMAALIRLRTDGGTDDLPDIVA